MNTNSESDDLSSIDNTAKLTHEVVKDRYISATIQAHREKIELNGRAQFFNLRKKWSWTLIIWISFILIFDSLLIKKIGIGTWKFEKYPWLIHEVIGIDFAQIVGMGYVIVNYLFPKINNIEEISEYLNASEDI
jgi:hypothetical protein